MRSHWKVHSRSQMLVGHQLLQDLPAVKPGSRQSPSPGRYHPRGPRKNGAAARRAKNGPPATPIALKWGFAFRVFRKIRTAIERTNDPNGSDEPIAFAYDRFQESLFSGIVTQCPANFTNDVIDVPFRVNEEIRMPQLGLNFLAGNQLFPSPDQENEKLHGFLFELYSAAIAAQFVATQVKLEIPTLLATPGNLFHR